MENDRKKRLQALKEAQHHAAPADDAGNNPDGVVKTLNKTEGDHLNSFLKEVLEQKEARKKQLEIVQDFFENPASYGVDMEIIPSSTTKLEIEDRKRDLKHKIDLLRSVLKALEGEMAMLSKIKTPEENENRE